MEIVSKNDTFKGWRDEQYFIHKIILQLKLIVTFVKGI